MPQVERAVVEVHSQPEWVRSVQKAWDECDKTWFRGATPLILHRLSFVW